MTIYIQLREAISDTMTVPQCWIKADVIEPCGDGIQFLDSKTGEWELIRMFHNGDFYWNKHIYDFCFIRPRLMKGCKLGEMFHA